MSNATCEYCQRQMRPGTGCVPHWYAADAEGRVKYAAEPYDGQWTGRICHDCNAPEGEPHHAGCDVERCPKCGLQAIGCDCDLPHVLIESTEVPA